MERRLRDTLWWTTIAIENGHRNSGFSHEKWWFSIAMLVHQRFEMAVMGDLAGFNHEDGWYTLIYLGESLKFHVRCSFFGTKHHQTSLNLVLDSWSPLAMGHFSLILGARKLGKKTCWWLVVPAVSIAWPVPLAPLDGCRWFSMSTWKNASIVATWNICFPYSMCYFEINEILNLFYLPVT